MIDIETEDGGKVRVIIPMTEVALYGAALLLIIWFGVTLGVVSARMVSW
jgi:hypothetical protein